MTLRHVSDNNQTLMYLKKKKKKLFTIFFHLTFQMALILTH